MERYSQAGLRKHRQIIGAITHGYGLSDVDLLHLSQEFQQFALARAVDDIP